MDWTRVPDNILSECISDTARTTNLSEQDVVAQLESRYRGITAHWNRYIRQAVQEAPPNVLFTILSSLSPKGINTLAQTSRVMNQRVRDRYLWTTLLERDWGVDYSGTDPIGEYRRLERLYIKYTEVPSMIQNFKTILLNNLPDTRRADPFKALVRQTTSFHLGWIDLAGDQDVDIDDTFLSTDELVPMRILKLSLDFVATASPWCSDRDEELWSDPEYLAQYVREQVYALYPFPLYNFGYSVDTVYQPTAISLSLSRRVETGPPTDTSRHAIPFDKVPEVASIIKTSLTSHLSASKEAAKLTRLIQQQDLFWVDGARLVLDTGGQIDTSGAVYRQGDTFSASSMLLDDMPRGVLYKVVYTLRHYPDDHTKIPRDCRHRNEVDRLNTVFSAFDRYSGSPWGYSEAVETNIRERLIDMLDGDWGVTVSNIDFGTATYGVLRVHVELFAP